MEVRINFSYELLSNEAREGVWAEIELMFICLHFHFDPSRSFLQFFDVVASYERR